MVANDPPALPFIHADIKQEIGVLVGFIALFAIVTAVFAFFWQVKNKRQAVIEEERQRVLQDKGFGTQGWSGPKDLKADTEKSNAGLEIEQEERVR